MDCENYEYRQKIVELKDENKMLRAENKKLKKQIDLIKDEEINKLQNEINVLQLQNAEYVGKIRTLLNPTYYNLLGL